MTPDQYEEHGETPENPSRFEDFVNTGIKTAKSIIKDRFENSPIEYNNLSFHNVIHTENEIRRTELILKTIQHVDERLVSERMIQLGRLAAGFHDVVQDWSENSVEDGRFTKVMRKRHLGYNEQKSAAEALDYMKRVNNEQRQEIFTQEDMEIVLEAIMATVPKYKGGTVIQPNLGPKSSLVARAVALADIGGAGMDGFEVFNFEGNALFREENLDIVDALQNPHGITPEQEAYFKARMLNYTKGQILFARKRRTALRYETAALPDPVQEAVRELFIRFTESIRGQRELYKARQTMTFPALISSVGF